MISQIESHQGITMNHPIKRKNNEKETNINFAGISPNESAHNCGIFVATKNATVSCTFCASLNGGSVNGAARINKHPADDFFCWFRLTRFFLMFFSWAFIICVFVFLISLRISRFRCFIFKTQIFRMSWEHHLKVSGCFYYFFHGWLGVFFVPWRSHPNPSTHGRKCRASERGSSRSIRQNLSKIQGVRLPKQKKTVIW